MNGKETTRLTLASCRCGFIRPEEAKAELDSFCRQESAAYKAPKIYEFIENVPLAAMGKVDKKVLR